MNINSERPRARLRERLREATVEAILQAAEQAFAAEGPKARMESIAALAGIAVGTLYNHFADREALWEELCRSRREGLLVRLDGVLAATRDEPFAGALRSFLGAFVAHWAAHRDFLAVLIQAEPLGARSPRDSRGRTMVEELVARGAVLVKRGMAAGALRPDGADLYPVLLLGMLRSILFQHLDQLPASQADAAIERLVDVFLHGAGRRA